MAVVTLWSEKTELFLEYPVLVRSTDSRFAIHRTRLNDFKPVRSGRCEIRLTYSDSSSESFTADVPPRPGIFGVTVKPARSGRATLEIRLSSNDLADSHEVGPVLVYGSAAEVPAEEESATEETISFLKEQQWALDFATEVAVPAW